MEKEKSAAVTLKLSKLQISKQGDFLGTLVAGLVGSLLPVLLGGKGLVLPGTNNKGLVFPGTKRQEDLIILKNLYSEKVKFLDLILHLKTFQF